jgi:hypothetical protein
VRAGRPRAPSARWPGLRIAHPADVKRTVCLLALAALGCASEPGPEEFLGVIEPPPGPYTVIEVVDGGRIEGVVTLAGARPVDSVVTVSGRDTLACGRTAVAATVAGTGNAVGGAIVWLHDARRGRALPLERRHELVVSRCAFEPRILAITTESVVNVFNEDRALHRVSLRRMGAQDTLAILPFYNSGQVVPSRQLAEETGLVEVRCAAHDWSRAYVAAFDHPYFAVTTTAGAFEMTDVPPGRYRLMAWHERLEHPVMDSVVVPARGQARATIVLPIGSPADTAP